MSSAVLRALNGYVDFENIDKSFITIEDIALGLSREARFNGHTTFPYYVAQHCVFCSKIAPEKYKLEALLHDATEAYMKDIPRPIKQFLPQYQEIESELDTHIRKCYGLPEEMSKIVRDIDNYALYFEIMYLQNSDIYKSESLVPFSLLSSYQCYDEFLKVFNELTKIRK